MLPMWDVVGPLEGGKYFMHTLCFFLFLSKMDVNSVVHEHDGDIRSQ